jgi:hypothetical protein
MSKEDSKSIKVINKGGPFGGVYFLTIIGAAVYFVQQSSGFWGFIGALLKGLVWPAFVIHRALDLLNM